MDYRNNPVDNQEEYTKFEDVYSLFLSTIQDYTIRDLFMNDIDTANQMVEYFLLKAIPKFRNCEKNLLNPDMEYKNFGVKLDLEEKMILSDLMVLSWMDRVINNITQMDMNLTDTDFKHFAEANNLKEKIEYADRVREKVYQDMTNYGLYRTPFSQWAAGNYGI